MRKRNLSPSVHACEMGRAGSRHAMPKCLPQEARTPGPRLACRRGCGFLVQIQPIHTRSSRLTRAVTCPTVVRWVATRMGCERGSPPCPVASSLWTSQGHHQIGQRCKRQRSRDQRAPQGAVVLSSKLRPSTRQDRAVRWIAGVSRTARGIRQLASPAVPTWAAPA